MKKIISTLLCAVIAFSGIITVNAADTETEIEHHKGFENLNDSFILPDNTVRMYSTVEVNVPTLSDVFILCSKDSDNEYFLYYNDCLDEYKDTVLEPGKYSVYLSHSIDSRKTGGIYKKVKIKLSEFNSCFDDEGKYYSKLFDNTFDYNYNEYGKKFDASAFTFLSGTYFQRMVPDENGEIEVYVGTEIGMKSTVHIQCSQSDGDTQIAGECMEYLHKLTFGNIDGNKYIDVNDVTTIQMYLAGIKKLDTLGAFHADTNCDGVYDVKDVTYLQLAIATLKG